jgi:hypothetical protein
LRGAQAVACQYALVQAAQFIDDQGAQVGQLLAYGQVFLS